MTKTTARIFRWGNQWCIEGHPATYCYARDARDMAEFLGYTDSVIVDATEVFAR